MYFKAAEELAYRFVHGFNDRYGDNAEWHIRRGK